MAINDVLPQYHLRPPDTMSLPTKNFGPNFDSFIYIRYAAPPYAARIVIIASFYDRWVKTPIIFLTFSIVLSSWKPSKNKQFLVPHSLEENPSNFWHAFSNLAHFPTCRKVWLSSGDLPLRRLAKKQHTAFTEGGSTFRHLWTKVREILRR